MLIETLKLLILAWFDEIQLNLFIDDLFFYFIEHTFQVEEGLLLLWFAFLICAEFCTNFGLSGLVRIINLFLYVSQFRCIFLQFRSNCCVLCLHRVSTFDQIWDIMSEFLNFVLWAFGIARFFTWHKISDFSLEQAELFLLNRYFSFNELILLECSIFLDFSQVGL